MKSCLGMRVRRWVFLPDGKILQHLYACYHEGQKCCLLRRLRSYRQGFRNKFAFRGSLRGNIFPLVKRKT